MSGRRRRRPREEREELDEIDENPGAQGRWIAVTDGQHGWEATL